MRAQAIALSRCVALGFPCRLGGKPAERHPAGRQVRRISWVRGVGRSEADGSGLLKTPPAGHRTSAISRQAPRRGVEQALDRRRARQKLLLHGILNDEFERASVFRNAERRQIRLVFAGYGHSL